MRVLALTAALVLLGAQTARAQDEPATVVFFAPGSAEVDAPGREQLQGWAAVALGHPDAQVIVSGHTDSAGTSEYNLELSRRRAAAVADALVSLGVPRDHIDLEATGEREVMVDTADGVSEPMNRRAAVRLAPERGIPICPGDRRCRRLKPPG